MIIKRDILRKIDSFINRREYLAIIGPRQCGKTTLLEIIRKHLIKEHNVDRNFIKTVTFEDRRLLAQFNADPVDFVLSYKRTQKGKKLYLMLDEFQYSDEGGQKLKLVYDTVKGVKVIITGSSSLDIKSQIGRYMVGRILTFHIYPFNFREYLRAKDSRLESIYNEESEKIGRWILGHNVNEFKKGRDVFSDEIIKLYEDFCIWGGYPAVVMSEVEGHKNKILNDIYSNYVLKDIKGLLELATENNLFMLSKYLATQMGNIVNYKNLSEASGLVYRQVKKHVNILSETFICTEVKPFFKNRQKELVKNPKIFFYDMGFRNNIIENMNGFDKRSDMGSIVENAVFNRLNEMSISLNKINFWRTKAGAEVDFIFHNSGEVIPVEVKFSGFKEARISRSFMSFIEGFNPPRGVVLTKNFHGMMKRGNTNILFTPVYYL